MHIFACMTLIQLGTVLWNIWMAFSIIIRLAAFASNVIVFWLVWLITLQWRHNVPHECFLNRLFRRRSQKTSKLRVTGLCEGNSPVTGEFPAKGPATRRHDVIMSIYLTRRSPLSHQRGLRTGAVRGKDGTVNKFCQAVRRNWNVEIYM